MNRRRYAAPIFLFLFLLASAALDRARRHEARSEPEPSAHEDALAARELELNDALMEEYLSLRQEMQASGDAGSAELLSRRGWTPQRLRRVEKAIARSLAPHQKLYVQSWWESSDRLHDQLLADLENQLAVASEEQIPALRAQLALVGSAWAEFETTRERLSNLEQRNAVVAHRWAPRIQTATGSK